MTFWEKAHWFSPIFCRLMARRNGRAMTDQEIANDGAIHIDRVEALSNYHTWVGVELGAMRLFLAGTGMDFTNSAVFKRTEIYLRGGHPFTYINKSPDAKRLHNLMIAWRRNYGVVLPDDPIWPPLRSLLIRLNPLLK